MREVWKLARKLSEDSGTRDPFALSAHLGIGVLYCDLPESVKGFYLKAEDGQVILLNQALEEPSARITCAHELGHALLHPDNNGIYWRTQTHLNAGRCEREADLFSAYLLFGDEPPQVETLEQLAAQAGAPIWLAQLYAEDLSQREQQRRTYSWSNVSQHHPTDNG